MEAVISCSSSDSNTLIWNPTSGATLKTLRGNTTEPGGVAVRGPHSNQLLAVQNTRQLLLSWNFSQEQSAHKSVTPEKLVSLTTTNDGLYAIGGSISGIVYVWNLNNGTLLTSLPIHFKGVRCLCVSDDDSLVMSGGEDGVVTVMVFGKMFGTANTTSSSTHPSILHTLTHHSLPVTSLTCGVGGVTSRFLSTSLDHTLKIYDTPTGSVLLSVLFPSSLLSSCWDPSERVAFVGGGDGRLFSVYVGEGERGLVEGEGEEVGGRRELVGHTGGVVSMDVSMDGGLVVSGSMDGKVCVWDVGSMTLLRSFTGHKGPVSFVKFCLLPTTTFTTRHAQHLNTTTPPSTLLQKFHYSLLSPDSPAGDFDPFQSPALLSLRSSSSSSPSSNAVPHLQMAAGGKEGGKMKEVREENERLKEENEKLEEELKKWKKACDDLYRASGGQ